MHFKLTGEFKPYVRMTRAGKFSSPAAQSYLSSQMALKLQFKQQCSNSAMPPRTPLAIRILIQSPGEHHHSDIDNQAKALLDAAQGIVFKNDMWIDSLEVRRETGPDYCVTFEVYTLCAQ